MSCWQILLPLNLFPEPSLSPEVPPLLSCLGTACQAKTGMTVLGVIDADHQGEIRLPSTVGVRRIMSGVQETS